MSGFVYKWTNTESGKYYIGSHKGAVDDGYIGSGLYFKRAYSKNPDNFKRDVLYTGDNFLELEDFILNELDAKSNQNMYNLKNSAIGGNTGLTEAGRKRLSESKKGTKNPNFGKPTWNKGLKRKPHVIEAIRKAQTGRMKTRDERLKASKYLFSFNGVDWLLASEVAAALNYKDTTTILAYARSGKNKRLKEINLKVKKL